MALTFLLLRFYASLAILLAGALATTEFTFEADGEGLQLGASGLAPTIFIDSNDFGAVARVATDLADDFERVLGAKSDVDTSGSLPTTGPAVIIGTIESSGLIASLVADGSIDVSGIEGKWEAYVAQTISDADGNPLAYVIAGSDKRGAVFGSYAISEAIGVSPWYWWADVPSKQREVIYVPTEVEVHGPPSVKFRGIFFNDEAPALMNWANENFPRSQYGNPFTSQFYEKAFELLLRLKGNYLWPAMWDGMFYLDDPLNGPMATEMGVFMGTSHHEPMARADKEQGRFMQGAWDWRSNSNGVKTFMTEGARRSKDWDTVYTLGMRGSGDAASATLNSQSLVEVIKWQQDTLVSEVGKPIGDIPQGWMMYKEVPGYWTRGMDVSDDVTLVWTDDNRGNIRRIPTEAELGRSGGSGMYYHFDYVGGPRNYKWINTIQVQKTWEQMHLAYERGIEQLWIANVGDLKAHEIPTNHFMDMAYDMTKFSTPDSTKLWLQRWAAREFGSEVALETADIMSKYGMLCARRKYEDLSYTPFPLSTSNYDEADANLKEWEQLVLTTKALYDTLDEATQISFYQTVMHPVEAGKGVFEIYSKAAIGARYQSENRVSTNQLAADARAAFSRDTEIQQTYHGLLGGKWNHMMDQTHIGYNNWQQPNQNSLPQLPSYQAGFGGSGRMLGIGLQGDTRQASDSAAVTLLPMSSHMPPKETRWFDVFMRSEGSMDYAVTTDSTFATITNPEGSLSSTGGSSDRRCTITIDWTQVPSGDSSIAFTVTAGSDTATVNVPLEKPELPETFTEGHVEFSGAISFEAGNFASVSSNDTASYVALPEYGRTHSGAKLWPVTTPSQNTDGPALEYPFFTFTATSQAKIKVYLSASENADWDHPNRYAVSVDGKEPTVVQPVAMAADQGQEPQGWDQAVISNAWVRENNVGGLEAGEHMLRVWLLEPTMVLTKVVVDVGGVKSSEMGPPESFMVSPAVVEEVVVEEPVVEEPVGEDPVEETPGAFDGGIYDGKGVEGR